MVAHEVPEIGSIWRQYESGFLGKVVGIEDPISDHLFYTVHVAIQVMPTLSLAVSLEDFYKDWTRARIKMDVSRWDLIKEGL